MNQQPPEPQHPDTHEGRLGRLAHRLAEADPNPTLPRGVRIAMTAGPFVGFGLILLVALIVSGKEAVAWLVGAELGSFLGFGKFVIFGGLFGDVIAHIIGYVPQTAPPSLWILAGLVVYGDLGTALVMMANMTLLYRAPFFGARLASCHMAGWQVLRVHRWMRRVAWLGVAVFVAAPFQGTGAVVGTILARILGLSRLSTLSATLAGSTAGCVALALLGQYGRQRVQQIGDHPYVAAVVVLLSIAVIVVMGRWFMGQNVRDHMGDPDEQHD